MCSTHLAQNKREEDFMRGPLIWRKDGRRSPASEHVEKASFGHRHRAAETLIQRGKWQMKTEYLQFVVCEVLQVCFKRRL